MQCCTGQQPRRCVPDKRSLHAVPHRIWGQTRALSAWLTQPFILVEWKGVLGTNSEPELCSGLGTASDPGTMHVPHRCARLGREVPRSKLSLTQLSLPPLCFDLFWDSGGDRGAGSGRYWRRTWVLGSEYFGLNPDTSVPQHVMLLCLGALLCTYSLHIILAAPA